SGVIWVKTSEGIFRRKPGYDAFEQIREDATVATGFIERSDGTLWVVDRRNGLQALLTSTRIPLPSDEISDAMYAFADSQSNLWIATNTGLVRHGAEWKTAAQRYTVETGLAGNVALTMLEDRERNVWVATGGGLTRMSQTPIATVPIFDNAPGLAKVVTIDRDGHLWVGTRKGLIRFSGGMSQTLGTRDGLPGATITALHADD